MSGFGTYISPRTVLPKLHMLAAPSSYPSRSLGYSMLLPWDSICPDPTLNTLQIVNHFEPAGAAALLEEEIREALLGTAGTAAGFISYHLHSASVTYLHVPPAI